MRDLFLKVAETPDRASYMAVRQAVLESPEYQPYSDELDRAEEMMDERKFAEARDCIQQGFPNLLLSPLAHLLLAAIAEELGDKKSEELEDFLATTCAEGILATGEGTQASPYLVVRTSDEYDLLDYLGKEPAEESQVREGERTYDRLTTTDAAVLWFDITEAYAKYEALPEES
jgi:hypothetical protein